MDIASDKNIHICNNSSATIYKITWSVAYTDQAAFTLINNPTLTDFIFKLSKVEAHSFLPFRQKPTPTEYLFIFSSTMAKKTVIFWE